LIESGAAFDVGPAERRTLVDSGWSGPELLRKIG
jgi:hypothetical protein